MKLTDSVIKAEKPKDKRYNLADGKGLVLFIEPSGGKFWRFRYKFQGKESTLSLDEYPIVKLAEARQEHIRLKELLTKGIDPSEKRKEEKRQAVAAAENSFESLARQC